MAIDECEALAVALGKLLAATRFRKGILPMEAGMAITIRASRLIQIERGDAGAQISELIDIARGLGEELAPLLEQAERSISTQT